MEPLNEFLSERDDGGIQVLADLVQQNANERWRRVLDENLGELRCRYDEVGEPAYGVFASILFGPVRAQLESAGYKSEPRFPGKLEVSEEWGPVEERQRWMWSVVRRERKAALGTIVVGLFHDHTRFRIPRPPEIVALGETDAEAVLEEILRVAVNRNQVGGSGY